MKATDLKQIMSLAWQFFKQTGHKFSECLKKAWANFKLIQRMKKGIVKFYFQKVDGSIREAWGTLKNELMPTTNENNRKKSDTVQVYYDTEVQGFRCFKKFNLL